VTGGEIIYILIETFEPMKKSNIKNFAQAACGTDQKSAVPADMRFENLEGFATGG
jgi:hypothetical protein